jgi:eukaryotic-like serine/threonine-protein kinase
MELPFSLTERYQLVSHIARGGMADVYEGRDGLLGRKVAVKVLHSQFSADEAFVKRFRREAQAAANLTHPNIVGIYDWGQLDSTYFIVMELVDGRSLREVLRSAGALLPRRAVEIAAEVSAALSVAHRAGLVHRDIKPGNILLAADGTVKVTDFGIARAWDDSAELTRTGAVLGTATYFSPEQAQGQPADERSDVYSLGVVLYEMVTGQPPFRGDSPVAVAYQHVSSEVPPPSAINPDVPAGLDSIVLKALNKDPMLRYQTAEDFRKDLWRILKGDAPVEAAAVAAPAADTGSTRMIPVTPPPATVPPQEAYRELEEAPASNMAFVLGTFALLATLGVLVFLLFRFLGGPGAGTDTVAVPNVVGLTQADAIRQISAAGLIPIPVAEENADFVEGTVIRTEPPADQEVARGSEVQVIVAGAIQQFRVPRLDGLALSDAVQLIETQGFQLGAVTEDPESDQEPGTVISQNPPAGSDAPPDTPIDLVISAGPETVILDDLRGLTELEATTKLSQAKLVWEIQRENDADVQAGRVIRTAPPVGAQLKAGDTVVLVISDGPEQVLVPDRSGRTVDAAASILAGLGLDLVVADTRIEVTDPNLVDRIVQQNPVSGTTVAKGSPVLVNLGKAPPPTTTSPPTTVAQG